MRLAPSPPLTKAVRFPPSRQAAPQFLAIGFSANFERLLMHIPEGILPPTVAIAGYALTGGLTWYSLRQIDREPNPTEKIPKASLMTAAFFAISLIHIPIPPTSIHLILNGLIGILLGAYAFPAILIGLLFQAVLFQHGGLSTLGINAALMGIPAILAAHFYRLTARFAKQSWQISLAAFVTGASALLLSASIFVMLIVTTIPADLDAGAEQTAIAVATIGYAIQAAIEGVFTSFLVSFLQRVKPELLENR